MLSPKHAPTRLFLHGSAHDTSPLPPGLEKDDDGELSTSYLPAFIAGGGGFIIGIALTAIIIRSRYTKASDTGSTVTDTEQA